MVGRAIKDIDWKSSASPEETSLCLRGAQIGGVRIPELIVHSGEVVGIAGVLGGGQTHILETLAGSSHHLEAEEIAVNGRTGCPKTVAEAIARGVYLVADERLKKAIFPGLSVEENLLTASLAETSRFGFMQERSGRAAAQDAIARLGIKCSGSKQEILQLSGGNQQKMVFGRWLIRMARSDKVLKPLLLLDNPTEGVDVGSKAELYSLIHELARAGASILITSAEFSEMLKLCDRIYCIANKTLGRSLDRCDFTEERLLLEVS
jgi:ribose transport system ATP-binding protein